jgi:hypothetical protein
MKLGYNGLSSRFMKVRSRTASFLKLCHAKKSKSEKSYKTKKSVMKKRYLQRAPFSIFIIGAKLI